MATQSPAQKTRPKLPRLPKDARISKRPLLRPPIPPPHAAGRRPPSTSSAPSAGPAAGPHVVYVQRATPFPSAVRRVRALLRGADRRAGQGARDRARRGGGGGKVPAGDVLLAAARAAATQDDAGREAVVVRGAGRAIDRVLRLAAWFEERAREEGVRVRLVTGSVCAIDDILPPVDPPAAGEAGPLPESRVRQVSVLEARISRR